jgi:HKD family nuclease
MKFKLKVFKSSTLYDLLEEYFSNAIEILIASAFIDDVAISLIESQLTGMRVNNRPLVKLLTGTFGRLNRKRNFERLLQLSHKYEGSLSVSISKNKSFHWKHFVVIAKTHVHIVVGSANFTENGLTSSGELIYVSFAKKNDSATDNFVEVFNNEFNAAFPINKFPLTKYKEAKLNSDSKADAEIESLLEGLGSKSNNNSIDSKLRIAVRALKMNYSLSKKVEEKVYRNKSDWHKKGYFLYGFSIKSDFEAAKHSDFLINFFFDRGKYFYAIGKKMDDDILVTGEEKYFVAYKEIKKRTLISNKFGIRLIQNRINYKSRVSNWKDFVLTKNQKEIFEGHFG